MVSTAAHRSRPNGDAKSRLLSVLGRYCAVRSTISNEGTRMENEEKRVIEIMQIFHDVMVKKTVLRAIFPLHCAFLP